MTYSSCHISYEKKSPKICKQKNNSCNFTNLMNEDRTLKTEVYLKEVVFVLHHEDIRTQIYMVVTEELQVPSTLTPRNVPDTQRT
jgi:hypothetical protein